MHEIPVRVMRAADIQYYTPPDVPVPRVQLELPYNRSMRTVIDRFKAMDRFCFVDGDMGGALTLRVENDRVHVKTFYSNLIPRYTEGMEEEEEREDEGPPEEEEEGEGEGGGRRQQQQQQQQRRQHRHPRHRSCSIKLDSKKLSLALHFLSIKYDTAICCMIEESCLVLHVTLLGGCGNLTYYLPIFFA
jgi:hypothetical protein